MSICVLRDLTNQRSAPRQLRSRAVHPATLILVDQRRPGHFGANKFSATKWAISSPSLKHFVHCLRF